MQSRYVGIMCIAGRPIERIDSIVRSRPEHHGDHRERSRHGAPLRVRQCTSGSRCCCGRGSAGHIAGIDVRQQFVVSVGAAPESRRRER